MASNKDCLSQQWEPLLFSSKKIWNIIPKKLKEASSTDSFQNSEKKSGKGYQKTDFVNHT